MFPLPEKVLESIQNDVRYYEDVLKKIAHSVVQQKISQHPIFIAHKEAYLPIGRPIINAEKYGTDWSINASLLEEFANKRLVESHRLAQFRKHFKDPKTHICLFIISGESDASFAFCPYRG